MLFIGVILVSEKRSCISYLPTIVSCIWRFSSARLVRRAVGQPAALNAQSYLLVVTVVTMIVLSHD